MSGGSVEDFGLLTTDLPPSSSPDGMDIIPNCSYNNFPLDWRPSYNFSDNGTPYPCYPEETPFDSFGPPWWSKLVVQILYGLVCLIGLCGNTLVIYVVVRFSKMQTVTNLYIVNLAIADECFLVGIPFLMTTITLGSWPFGKFVCKAYFTSTSINQITSSMFLLIMSADRYLAVCHPISAPKWRTPLIAKVVALTAWTISALLMVPIFMYANTLELDGKVNCNIFWPEGRTMSGEIIFIMYSFFLGFAVPLILILVFYILVIMRLKTVGPKRSSGLAQKNSKDQSRSEMNQSQRAKERKKSHRKVTKLVLTVITVYFLCWAPYWATQMALMFMPQEPHHSGSILTMFLLAGCLSYSNSTMNPILYAFLSDNFKKSFLKACTCATGKDVNATLHLENSIFPRGKKHSKRSGRKSSAPLTSATFAGTTAGQETTATGDAMTRSSVLGMSSTNHLSPAMAHHIGRGSLTGGGSSPSGQQLLFPPSNNKKRPSLEEIMIQDDSDDDEFTTILVSGQINGTKPNTTILEHPLQRQQPEVNRVNISVTVPSSFDSNNILIPVPVSHQGEYVTRVVSPSDTFIQENGVHVTAL